MHKSKAHSFNELFANSMRWSAINMAHFWHAMRLISTDRIGGGRQKIYPFSSVADRFVPHFMAIQVGQNRHLFMRQGNRKGSLFTRRN